MTVTEESTAPMDRSPTSGDSSPARPDPAAERKPKLNLPGGAALGLVLYMIGFGINITGLVPGVEIDVPAGTQVVASVVGLILMAAATTLTRKATWVLLAMAVVAAVFFVATIVTTDGDEDGPYLEATIAWLRAEPRIENPGVDQLIRNNQQPNLELMNEHRTATGWFRVQTERDDIGWMFASLIGGYEHDTYRTAETLNQQTPALVDAQGEPTGEFNETGRLVLVTAEVGDLYRIVDPDGRIAYVVKDDFRLV